MYAVSDAEESMLLRWTMDSVLLEVVMVVMRDMDLNFIGISSCSCTCPSSEP
jgi:hypothetical protein